MVVVGGYESGVDAAVNLVEAGDKLYHQPCMTVIWRTITTSFVRAPGVESVFVFDKHAHWKAREGDPSEILSPRTFGRLDRVMAEESRGGTIPVHQANNIRGDVSELVGTTGFCPMSLQVPEQLGRLLDMLIEWSRENTLRQAACREGCGHSRGGR